MELNGPEGEHSNVRDMGGRCVWFINHYAIEPGRSGGTRHYSLARNLRRHGWNTTIFAASTVLNSQEQRLSGAESVREEVHDGVVFRWLKTRPYIGNGFGRIVNMVAFAARLLTRKARRGVPRPNIIIGSTVHPLAAASGAILSRLYKVPFVFEIRDLWPETLIDMGAISRDGVTAKLLRRLESSLCKRASLVVYLPPKADRYLIAQGVPPEKLAWIPNGIDYMPDSPDVRHRDSKEFTLMYFGAHGDANGLDAVVRAMALVEKTQVPRRIRLRIIGDGPAKPALLQLAKDLGLGNVEFHPPIPKQSIPEVAATADAFVFSLKDIPVFQYGISANKLFDYLAAARPILYFCNQSTDIVEESGAGVCVAAEDSDALAEAIVAISNLPREERSEMGRRGRAYVMKRYTFDSLARDLAVRLDAIDGQTRVHSGGT